MLRLGRTARVRGKAVTHIVGNRLNGTRVALSVAYAAKPRENYHPGKGSAYRYPIEGQSLTIKELCAMFTHVTEATMRARLNKQQRTFAQLGKTRAQAQSDAAIKLARGVCAAGSRMAIIKAEKAAHFAALRAGHKQL